MQQGDSDNHWSREYGFGMYPKTPVAGLEGEITISPLTRLMF